MANTEAVRLSEEVGGVYVVLSLRNFTRTTEETKVVRKSLIKAL